MKKRMAVMVLLLVAVFGAVFGWKAFVGYKMGQAMAHAPKPKVTITTALVQARQWRAELDAVGSLAAIQGVILAPQLPGKVTRILFHSGQAVPAGALLVQQDDSNQRAQLALDLAQEALARSNLARTRELYAKNAASRAQLDQAEATQRSTRAQVANDRATLAKLALRAPFAGVLGIRQVNLGQYLAPGAPVVSLQNMDPLYVNFSLPQQDLGRLHLGQMVRVSVDAYGGKAFDARINALNSQVSAATRNIDVQARLPNPGRLLRPGMYARIKVIGTEERRVLTLPISAITYNTYGSYVYVVTQQHGEQMAQQRVVKTGEQRGNEVVVLEGLKDGEQVVNSGQNKLRNDTPVVVNNSVAP